MAGHPDHFGETERLASDIVRLAVKDWKQYGHLASPKQRNSRNLSAFCLARAHGYRAPRQALIAFFRSDWCKYLWDNVVGEMTLEEALEALGVPER